jgi:hypothetical protein
MKKFLLSISLFLALSFCFICFGQTKVDPAEISSTIQELTDFHDIIYPMWHDAYPAKDYNALKGFVPKIKSDMESLNKVKLPGTNSEKGKRNECVCSRSHKHSVIVPRTDLSKGNYRITSFRDSTICTEPEITGKFSSIISSHTEN